MTRVTVRALVALMFLAACAAVHAEVVARTDRDGDYVATQVLVSAGAGGEKIWTPRGRSARALRYADPLNAYGDQNGDGPPAIGEPEAGNIRSWVVWSRYNGDGYDLAYSNWQLGGWDAIRWVHPRVSAEDERDPAIDIGLDGTPYITWWAEVGGEGVVYISRFRGGEWSDPFRVSPQGTDARLPDIRVTSERVAFVQYRTPQGTVVQAIEIVEDPGTITDDINPVGLFQLRPDSGPGGIAYNGG